MHYLQQNALKENSMKTIFILTLILIFSGCNNSNKSNTTPPVETATPEPTEQPEEILKICSFIENVNTCQISEFSFRKLVRLSHSGILLSKIIDLREIKEKYRLDSDQVQCLKNNFCKEEI